MIVEWQKDSLCWFQGSGQLIAMFGVTSSNIEMIGYDPKTKALAIRFKSSLDSVYVYRNVPANVAEVLKAGANAGASVGALFARVVRKDYDQFEVQPWRQWGSECL